MFVDFCVPPALTCKDLAVAHQTVLTFSRTSVLTLRRPTVTDFFYWCASWGRASILAEVPRFGVGTAPYVCPGCVVVEADKITIPPDKNALRPYYQARKEHPNFPVLPIRGQTYR